MRTFNQEDFFNMVEENKDGDKIKNGTEFMVVLNEVEIGKVAIQRTMIVNLMQNKYPQDLGNNKNYIFIEIEEEQ